ncbi:hypothetical protein AMATHDRAFT_2115 [Amanita thiersii Skay4041]|uniref:Uncharacterized protein n=1 Tax=Amanita thiersii Skay4041 TaxID=703135 RepID=A0A2A9NX55_9AGAR|nr:hypothetical protein AMATHDRAFT_2115 [Amanita thiersii Skay4041]
MPFTIEDVGEAFRALQADLSNRKETPNNDLISLLSTVTDTIGMPTVSQRAFQKLRFILRSRMQPLYRISLQSSLHYAVVVFMTIYETKVRKFDKDIASWEGVQQSVLSGILDFLEQASTRENQSAVAAVFYPMLCESYFPRPSKLFMLAGEDILCTILQILSETVMAHPSNQQKLRDPKILGGQSLGQVLEHYKGFLTIEALLELLANLAPSIRGRNSHEERASFFQQVFDPAQLDCSAEIIGLMKCVTSADWDTTLTKIYDLLARSNKTFPQPFETTQVRTNGTSHIVSRIYIDKNAFLANVQEDGRLDTFQLSFPTIQMIEISEPSAFMVTVIIAISSSPLLGHTPVFALEADGMSVSFDLRKEEVGKFLSVLRSRGLQKAVVPIKRKISKAETHVDLGFGLRAHLSPQKKIENLSQLWGMNVSPSHANESITSPLHVQELVKKVVDSFPPNISARASQSADSNASNEHVAAQTDSLRDVIFGSSDDELTDITGLEDSMASAAKDKNKEQTVRRRSKRHEKRILSTPAEPVPRKRPRKSNIHASPTGQSPPPSEGPTSRPAISFVPKRKPVIKRQGRTYRILSSESELNPDPLTKNDQSKQGVTSKSVASLALEKDTKEEKCGNEGGKGRKGLPGDATESKNDTKQLRVEGNTSQTEHSTPVVIISQRERLVKDFIVDDPQIQHSYLTSKERSKAVPSNTGEHRGVLISPAPFKSSQEKVARKLGNPILIDLTQEEAEERVPPGVSMTAIAKVGSETMHNAVHDAVRYVERSSRLPVAASVNEHIEIELLPKLRNTTADQQKVIKHAIKDHETEYLEKLVWKATDIFPDALHYDSPTSPQRIPSIYPVFAKKTRLNPHDYSRRTVRNRYKVDENVDMYNGNQTTVSDGLYEDVQPLPKIVKVIEEITEVVIKNTSNRFEYTRKNIHAAQVNILAHAEEDLIEMHRRSSQHYNELGRIANKYSSHEKQMIHTLDELVGAEMDIVRVIRDILLMHDRSCLSPKFPKTLLPSLPSAFSQSNLD